MHVYHDLPSMQAAVADINARGSEVERIEGLCGIAYRPQIAEMGQVDPFSPEYRAMVIEVYKTITGRASYNASENERSPYLAEISRVTPGFYEAGSTTFVGDVLTAMGQVLIALDAKPGQRILEYGAGEGGIALEAAKAGCDVTVVDVEPLYLGLIEQRAQAAGVRVRTVRGEFGCDCGGGFDRILFYEAFHHALDHANVARKLHNMLSPGGFLVLAGEPVIGSHNAHWRPTLSYPWGLRLDGLSFRAISTYGWMELGFDQSYLVEMLMRAGFFVQFRACAATERGSAYIARPYAEEMHLGGRFLLSAYGRDQEWHDGEGEHRWTAAEEAVLPLRGHDGRVAVTVVNYHSQARAFELESAGKSSGGSLSAGGVRTITLPASNRLYIRSQLVTAGGEDPRVLGLAVKSVKYV